jgi:hypothetical protein
MFEVLINAAVRWGACAEAAGLGADGIPGITGPDDEDAGLPKYPAGLALNFSTHPAQQK